MHFDGKIPHICLEEVWLVDAVATRCARMAASCVVEADECNDTGSEHRF
jgi:hypothetical protein